MKDKTLMKLALLGWRKLKDNEINSYIRESLPAPTTVSRCSEEINKTSGEVFYLEALNRWLQNSLMVKVWLMLLVSFLLLSLTGCSGEAFHLRGSVALADDYKRVYLQGEPLSSDFGKVLQRAFEEAGSELVNSPEKATAILQLNDYKEGKRVAGYGKNREVREYLIFLRFNFETKSVNEHRSLLSVNKINLDKLQVYDSAFVLGKIEEERLIKQDLRKNAARQVIIRLKYGNKK